MNDKEEQEALVMAFVEEDGVSLAVQPMQEPTDQTSLHPTISGEAAWRSS